MPAALPAHLKSLAQALWMQGLKSEVIAQRLALNPMTLETWAKRGQWTALRHKVNDELVRPEEQFLHRESIELRKRVAAELHRVAQDVQEIPRGRRTAAQRAGLLESITRSARTVLGWSESGSGKTIDVAALASALPAVAALEPVSQDDPQPALPSPQPDEPTAQDPPATASTSTDEPDHTP